MRLYTLDLYGEKFNSSQFAELPFIKPYTERTIKLISFGEKAKIGRHKGKPSPYGCFLFYNLSLKELQELVSSLIKNYNLVSETKVAEILVDSYIPLNKFKNENEKEFKFLYKLLNQHKTTFKIKSITH